MNKITKPILVSALSALAFGTVGVAGTFALFTDNGDTQISAKAGIVSVKAAIGNLKTYSAKAASDGDVIDEFGGKYNIVETENSTFTNGGTASIDTQTGYLSLDKITPGDRVSFVVTPSTSSNVDVMYRVSYKVVNDSTHNLELAKGLTTRIGANPNQESYEGLEEYRSGWTYAQAVTTSTSLTGIPFEIELPITAGNEYQNKEATIAVTVEGVQGNAAIQDGKYAKAIDKAIETTVSEGTEATELEATNATQTATVKTIIPANTQEVEAGDSVTLVVGDIAITENEDDPDNDDLEFDASLYVNDIKVTSFSKQIHVQVNIGPNLNIVKLTHSGSVVTEYTYNKTTGILGFYTDTFSPFVITYNARNSAYGFYDNYEEKVGTVTYNVHVINNLSSLKAIGTYLNSSDGADDDYPVFRLKNNIDISDLGSPISVNFRGTFDGNNKTLYGASGLMTISAPNSAAIFSEYDKTSSLTVKDLTLDQISVEATEGQGAALLFGGKGTSEQDAGCSMTFTNVHATDSCSIVAATSKAGTFVGKAYGVVSFSATGCTSAASIATNGGNANVGGFAGTFTNSCGSTSFTNCTFSGKLKGDNYIGGFTAQNNKPNATISYTGCKMLGTVTATTENAGSVGAFHSATGAGATITYSGCALYDTATNKTAKYRLNVSGDTVDTSKINGHGSFNNGIAVPEDLTTIFTKANIGSLTYSVDPSTHDITVEAYPGAAYYRAVVRIDGKAVDVSGNQVSLHNTRGITIASENFATVNALKEGFGEIHRLGYIIEDESTPSNPTVFSLDPAWSGGTNIAYIQDNRMCFLRVASDGATVTAIGGLQNTNKLVKDKENGVWLLVVMREGTAISPVGADCNYTIEACDSEGNVIANASFQRAVGSSMVPLNMSGIDFNDNPTINQPYYEYLPS